MNQPYLNFKVTKRGILISFWITCVILFTLSEHLHAQSTVDFSERADRIISKVNLGEYDYIHGLLIWKDGRIIGEHYSDGWSRNRPHMLQSVTKSITSLLIGIAIHERFIPDTKQQVIDYFPEYDRIQNFDDHKRSVTIEDLLTMRTGMEWVEHPYQGSPLAEMNRQRGDWVKFVLDIPMREAPGQIYIYNSGGVILLGGIIESASGMSVQDFATQYFFAPLEITTAEWWFIDQRGLPHTGGGLRMTPGEMLKIGRLILQCGEWDGRQILDCDYVKKLFRNYQSKDISRVAGYSRGYSQLWHVFPMNPDLDIQDSNENFIAAWGAEGQWIMIFPDYQMIIIFTGNSRSFEEETEPIHIVYEFLLQ